MWQPFVYGILLAMGVAIGVWLKPGQGLTTFSLGNNKFSELFSLIRDNYVDTVNIDELQEKTLNNMLSSLDPHSVYIDVNDVPAANEQLEGEFEGIGVEFNILNDTIMVVSALSGGPSAELGIQSGDRIIKADSVNLAGVGVTNEKVIKTLRGPGNSHVKVTIFRPSTRKLITFDIKRGTIPINSIDAALMLNASTAYIKLSRFAEKTHEEFLAAFEKLASLGKVNNLVLDLRGNPGGFLQVATLLTDELLGGRKLIVYTQGRTKHRQEYETERPGIFESGQLVVLIDEGSASASEIVSGAIQDWDRGLIIGRRSFGKGLVQEPFELSDGSALRLTVSRYYTPSGRCIQKSYNDYSHDLRKRIESGELESENMEMIFDSTPYYTKIKNRKVYGGGGISPDIRVAIDTSYYSAFLTNAFAGGMLSKFAFDYTDRNREKLLKQFKSANEFETSFALAEQDAQAFISFCTSQSIKAPDPQEWHKSGNFVSLQLKALIARQLWKDNGYYEVICRQDKMVQRALEALKNYDKVLSLKLRK